MMTRQPLDAEEAAFIAEELGYRLDITANLALANSHLATHNPEELFRGYLRDELAESNAESAMLERTGYGLVER